METTPTDTFAPPEAWTPAPSAAERAPALPAPLAARQLPRRSPTTLILGFSAVVAVAGLAFAAGRVSAPSAVAATGGTTGQGAGGAQRNGAPPANGGPGGPGGFGGAGGIGGIGGSPTVAGTVSAITSTSITIALASGSTVEIPIDGSTAFHAATSATSSDVSTGDTVTIQVQRGGPSASGGSVGTATDVTVTSP